MSSKSSKSKAKSQAEKAAMRKAGRELFKQGVKEVSQNPNNLGLLATAVSKGQNWKNAAKQAGATVAAGALGAASAGKSGALKTALTAAAVQQAQNLVRSAKGTNHIVKGALAALFNDLEWYNNYPEMLEKMIGPNFNIPIGVADTLLDLNPGTAFSPSIPSTASISVELCLGDNTDRNRDAAITRIFTSIRQANSGSVNYNSKYLESYIYNVRQIIAVYSICCRALRELNKASLTDKGVPYARFGAMGLDYDSFAENAGNLRNLLVNLKVRLKSYAIMDLDILKRTEWLFRSAYWDSNDKKHQTYFFRMNRVLFYDPTTDTTSADYLTSGPSTLATGMTYSTFITNVNNIIDKFYGVQIYSVIAGDIVKAYGIDSLYHLPEVPSVNDLPMEGFSEEVLTQIQNIWCPKTVEFNNPNHIIIDNGVGTNALTEAIDFSSPSMDSNILSAISSKVLKATYLNYYKNDISNLDVIQASRFINFANYTANSITLATWGTEVVVSMHVFYFDYSGLSSNKYNLHQRYMDNIETYNITGDTGVEAYGISDIAWAAFDYFPRVIKAYAYYPQNSSTLSHSVGGTQLDWNIYAKIEGIEQLRFLHDIAITSMLFTPLLVKPSNNVVEY